MNNKFVICINNSDYPSSLELLKVYKLVPDEKALLMGFLRIVDETGEDYLFSKDHFAAIEIPTLAETVFERG